MHATGSFRKKVAGMAGENFSTFAAGQSEA